MRSQARASWHPRTADDGVPVTTDRPNGTRRSVEGRNGICRRDLASVALPPVQVQVEIDFGQREARQRDLEVEIDERLQLDRQDLAVPTGVEGELVVREDVGAPFFRREMGQPERGNRVKA